MKKMLFVAVLLCIMLTTSVFATNQTTVSKPLWKAESTRNKIVAISDLHLGIDDKISETIANRAYLVDFLKRIQVTKDVRELVIGGDFLDDWFLPLSYPTYSDTQAFYSKAIKNNQAVFDELNKAMDKGIKVVYVPGNHDMLLTSDALKKGLPKIVFVGEAGLGTYITGDRQEIAIEHGNRYDIFSAPDTVDNKELTGGESILPPGYFYARIAASWMLQGMPPIKKDLPEITIVPINTDIDQFGAYLNYALWNDTLNRFTIIERFDDKVFDLKIAGFNGKYSAQDIYPVLQKDGTISAPILFKNFQRTWDERQTINGVNEKSSFIEAATAVTGDCTYYFPKQEELQYANKNIDIVVFGHTHYPLVKKFDSGITTINDGTWIDNNTSYPTRLSRTFIVISTGNKTTAAAYSYGTDGKIEDITKTISLQTLN